MHHRSTQPPLTTRSFGRRLPLRLAVTSFFTVLAIGGPVAYGAVGTTRVEDPSVVALVESPVVMGLDGLGAETPPPLPVAAAPGTETAAAVPAEPPPSADPVTPAAEPPAASPEPTATQAARPAEPAGPGLEGQVLALVNSERAAAGCGALAADDGLAAVARAHSVDMRDRGFFDHVDPDGLDPFDRAERAGQTARAENIAYGQPDPAAVMTAWMNSPGHRANILDCDLTRLGVGVAQGAGGPWWTQLFG